MAVVHPTINDQITRLQLRLLKQRLDSEQKSLDKEAEKEKEELIEDKYNRLQEAAARRQELLDRLQQERLLHEELNRPRTFPGLPQVDATSSPRQRHQQSHQPHHRRSESQPQFKDARSPNPYASPHLNPIGRPQNGSGLQPLLPAALPPIPAQPYLLAPGAPGVMPGFQQTSQPPSNNRADMYELMMIQNAQMHQMIMQQLMMSSIPRPQPPPVNTESTDTRLSISLKDLIDFRKTATEPVAPARPPSVHYHHYDGGLADGKAPLPPIQSDAAAGSSAGYPYSLPPVQVLPVVQPYVTSGDQTAYANDAEYPSQLHRNYYAQHNSDAAQQGVESG